jgi:hypothetical protein
MWGPYRQSLIKRHQFYVKQARKRVLSQFENMEEEADKAAEEWLEQSSGRFDPDWHDPGDFYEAANDVGIEFYQLLSDMRNQTRLSVVAGMFHEWDKNLRGLAGSGDPALASRRRWGRKAVIQDSIPLFPENT